MTNSAEKDELAGARKELKRLELQAEKARILLTRLQQDIVGAGNNFGDYTSLLIEANQQLVLTTLETQTAASVSPQELRELRKISELAQRDALTELPTRLLLLDRFRHATSTAQRRGTRLALLFLDLDNFKKINDTLGHAAGDQVLKRVAQCLATAVRGADTVSRHGGDEFLILLAEVSEPADAILIANKALSALSVPTAIGDQLLELSASIGISLYPDHGTELDVLVQHADTAMYHAKRHKLGSFVYQLEEPSENATADSLYCDNTALSPQDSLHINLRSANEQLMLSALSGQERLDAAEKTQRRQAEFLAVLTHELRSPLSPILNAAALLEYAKNDEALLREVKAVIERQVVHLSRLIGDVLDVARAASGKLRLERQKTDLMYIVNQVADNSLPLFTGRNQKFAISAPEQKIHMDADPMRLGQIVGNLLSNASKYTPVGGAIELKVAVAGNNVFLNVSDNGIGISADVLPYIFKPFVQDPNAAKFNAEGMGIGLAVVRELVEGHGGTVVAMSEGPGLGSEFIVTLPILPPSEDSA